VSYPVSSGAFTLGEQLTPDEMVEETTESLSQAEGERTTQLPGRPGNTFTWRFFPEGQSTLQVHLLNQTHKLEKPTSTLGKLIELSCETAASFISVVMDEHKLAEI